LDLLGGTIITPRRYLLDYPRTSAEISPWTSSEINFTSSEVIFTSSEDLLGDKFHLLGGKFLSPRRTSEEINFTSGEDLLGGKFHLLGGKFSSPRRTFPGVLVGGKAFLPEGSYLITFFYYPPPHR
jgi:hypothetical protein